MATVDSIHDIRPQLANNRAYWLAWGSMDSIDADLPMYRTGLRYPLLNGVLRVRRKDFADARCAASQRLEGTRWMWWVGADSDPDIAADLSRRGVRTSGVMPVMAVSLNRLRAVSKPADVTIAVVDGAEEIAAFARAYATSMGVAQDDVDEIVRLESGRSRTHENLTRFAARIDGRTVATCAVSISHGVAGVYVVTTDPAYRGRGIGRAVVTAALDMAHSRGLLVGTLLATPGSEPMYDRMGFRAVSRYLLIDPGGPHPGSGDHVLV